jgi:hypothetical protein
MNATEALAVIRKVADVHDNHRNSAEQFERACLFLAEEWARDQLAGLTYSLSYRSRQPIDIMIFVDIPRLPAGPGRLVSFPDPGENHENTYYIECKLYGRPLGLNEVAKSYLMALRNRPIGLVIASNQIPTHPAHEFAQWISSQSARGIVISYWNPIDEGSPARSPRARQRRSVGSELDRPFALVSWSLARNGPFGQTPLAKSEAESGLQLLDLFPDDVLSFKAILKRTGAHRKGTEAHLLVGDAEPVPMKLQEISSSGLHVQCTLAAQDLVPGHLYQHSQLRIRTNAGENILTLGDGFPTFVQLADVIQLPDLRHGMVNRDYADWIKQRDKRLLTVRGEGGIGKTYFCEGLAKLAVQDGYHIAQTTLTVETGIGFVSEFLWLLLPAEIRHELKSLGDVALTESLIEAVLERHSQGDVDGISQSLARLLLSDRLLSGETEPIMQSIARLLVNSTRPLVFIASNCQRIADAPAYALKMLLGALEQEGWGNVRVILEYRNTTEHLNDTWRSVSEWMDRTLAHRRYDILLTSLDSASLKTVLGDVLVTPDIDEVTALIVDKAGGNPLYVSNLLRSLVDNNLARPTLSQHASTVRRYSVDSLPEVREFVTAISADVEMLLWERIAFYHEKFGRDSGIGAIVLGLNAVVGPVISSSLLAQLLDTSLREIELELMRFRAVGLVVRKGDDEFAYAHEFAHTAALKWFIRHPDNLDITLDAASSDVPVSYNMALAKGKLNAFLDRRVNAVEAFNAAAQLANGDFVRELPCYRHMADQLVSAQDEAACNAYHAAIGRLLKVGHYILGRRHMITVIEAALAHLDQRRVPLPSPTVNFYRQSYHHDICSASLHLLNWSAYQLHASKAIEYCRDELGMARILNRLVKFACMIGTPSIGRAAALLATAVQKSIAREIDPALPNVLMGEMAILYLQIDSSAAAVIVDTLLADPADDRQTAHDLAVAATVACVRGDRDASIEYLARADVFIAKYGLESLRTTSGIMHGVLDLLSGNPQMAADHFKRCSLNAAWQDNIRDELRCASNLLVARIACDDLSGAREVYERTLSLIQLVAASVDHDAAVALLAQAHAVSVHTFKVVPLTNEEAVLYPRLRTERRVNLFAVMMHNAHILSNWQPKIFAAPERWLGTLSAEPWRNEDLPHNVIGIWIAKLGAELQAIC